MTAANLQRGGVLKGPALPRGRLSEICPKTPQGCQCKGALAGLRVKPENLAFKAPIDKFSTVKKEPLRIT